MKLEVTITLDVAKVNEILGIYLTTTEVGKHWSHELCFLTNDKKRYLQPFLERALADVKTLESYYQADDWWKCAVMSVEYFREAFKIENPVEIIRDGINVVNGDISYGFVFDANYSIQCSEIMIERHLNVGSDRFLSSQELIGAVAHEAWHAHQIDRALKFLQRENGMIDFDAIDPTSLDARGAIYVLSNIVMYEDATVNRVLYCNQIAEAEAIYIQRQVESHLAS